MCVCAQEKEGQRDITPKHHTKTSTHPHVLLQHSLNPLGCPPIWCQVLTRPQHQPWAFLTCLLNRHEFCHTMTTCLVIARDYEVLLGNTCGVVGVLWVCCGCVVGVVWARVCGCPWMVPPHTYTRTEGFCLECGVACLLTLCVECICIDVNDDP